MTATTSSRIIALSKEIATQTTKLDEYFTSRRLTPPSLDEDSPLMYPGLPPDVRAAQEALAEALDELWWVNQGPIQTLHAKAFLAPSVGLKTILRFDIHKLVPLNTGTTFKDLAERTGLPEGKLTRILRIGMTDHLFREPEPGRIKHTAATKALVTLPPLPLWVSMGLDEVQPAIAHTADAFAKWPESEESNNAGFQLAHQTDKEMHGFFSSLPSPQRALRFKGAMAFMESMPGLEITHVAKLFDWASLPLDATVVDVGGSHGHVAINLARSFPRLRFVVQDLPRVIEATSVPDDLTGRIEFQAHDFFTPQKVQADVFYFRLVSHGWSDKYLCDIMRAHIPALKPGARLLFNDKCLAPPATLPVVKERWQRNFDLVMMATENSAERDELAFRTLVANADPRFEFEGIRRTPGSNLDMVVVKWTGCRRK